jgi:hypothetical protein
LFEVPPIFLVDQDQIEIITGGEFLVDVSESRCEIEAAEEEPDGDCLASDGGAVHYLELGDGL